MSRRRLAFKTLLLATALLLFPSMTVQAAEANYTYTYDYWGEVRQSPDAYAARMLITGESLGIGDFKDPQSIYVKENRIYVCDTGNNRIAILERNGDEIGVVDTFSKLGGKTDVNTLSAPQDIFVADNGDMYICDSKNQRVVHINKDYEVIKELIKPIDETVDVNSDFIPLKAVADAAGRVFVLVKNYNKGFVEFENDGQFLGYIGANAVKFDMLDYLWKFAATKAQRAQMAQFVPTEYNNLSLDKDGFIYCTTSVFEEPQLKSDEAKPIRKLNAMGADILVKNGEFPPIGDIDWGNAGGISGASKLVDITAMDNETYYAIDKTRGRIFGYDSQGNLLYAFGGLGNKLGYFQYPTAIEHMGEDLLVLDSKNIGITLFTQTPYGELISRGLAEYKRGNYDASADYWQEVLMQNGNYDLAYIGIGRSLLRQERYEEAMAYFKLKMDDDNYSKAYKLYRKQWIEEHIGIIFGGVLLVIVITGFINIIKKIKKEVAEDEYRRYY